MIKFVRLLRDVDGLKLPYYQAVFGSTIVAVLRPISIDDNRTAWTMEPGRGGQVENHSSLLGAKAAVANYIERCVQNQGVQA